MAAMIGRRKNCFRGVFAFEHSGGMRHANQEHRVFAGFGRRVLHGRPGMLLEHVVNVLHARDRRARECN